MIIRKRSPRRVFQIDLKRTWSASIYKWPAQPIYFNVIYAANAGVVHDPYEASSRVVGGSVIADRHGQILDRTVIAASVGTSIGISRSRIKCEAPRHWQ